MFRVLWDDRREEGGGHVTGCHHRVGVPLLAPNSGLKALHLPFVETAHRVRLHARSHARCKHALSHDSRCTDPSEFRRILTGERVQRIEQTKQKSGCATSGSKQCARCAEHGLAVTTCRRRARHFRRAAYAFLAVFSSSRPWCIIHVSASALGLRIAARSLYMVS